MDEDKVKKAEKKIQKVLMDWFTSDAILLGIASQFNFNPDPNQETFGINITGRHPVITFNPNFVNMMPVEYLEMVMVHTFFKVLLRHCTTRLKEPRQISALSSNIAIDELIRQNTMAFLQGDTSLEDLIPTAQQFNLPEKDCFEEYFRQLYDRQQQINEMIKQIWDSMTDEEKQEMIDKAQQQAQQGQGEGQDQEGEDKGQDKGEGKGQDQEEQNGEDEGEGQGQGKGQNKDKDGFKEYDNTQEGVKDYFDPNGTANNGWGKNDMFDADVKNYVDKNKDRIKAWGKHTGDYIAEILAANEPKISYKEIIRKFKKSVETYARVNSRLKANRRFDLLYPGHRRFLKTKIIFAVDVSGSMSDDDLAEGFAVINKIIKHAELIYVLFDTEIKQIETKLKTAKKTFKICGRGGTDFQEVLDYADETKCDGVVIFSDMFAPEPKKPKAKVLFLSHSKDLKPNWNWGFQAVLDRHENLHNW